MLLVKSQFVQLPFFADVEGIGEKVNKPRSDRIFGTIAKDFCH